MSVSSPCLCVCYPLGNLRLDQPDPRQPRVQAGGYQVTRGSMQVFRGTCRYWVPVRQVCKHCVFACEHQAGVARGSGDTWGR